MNKSNEPQCVIGFRKLTEKDGLFGCLIDHVRNPVPGHLPNRNYIHVEISIRKPCSGDNCPYTDNGSSGVKIDHSVKKRCHWVTYGVRGKGMYRYIDKYESKSLKEKYTFVCVVINREQLDDLEAFLIANTDAKFGLATSIWNYWMFCRWCFPIGVTSVKQITPITTATTTKEGKAESKKIPDPRNYTCSEFVLTSLCFSGVLQIEDLSPVDNLPVDLFDLITGRSSHGKICESFVCDPITEITKNDLQSSLIVWKKVVK